MKKEGRFEVCAFHIDSCLTAEREGAYRVELCDNPIEGGTTPGYGTIKRVREKISIMLYPILRPRSGSYFYSDEEFEILKYDIAICKELGCDGISVGVQSKDGTIDKDRFKRVVEWAGAMGVTCNRVFDNCPDPFAALEAIIECGCERVLTSGLKTAAPDAGELLGKLVQQANDRISIMPGAGVNASNIAQLRKQCGAYEFHGSARMIATNLVEYANPAVNDYGSVYVANPAEVRAMVNILKETN